MVYYGARDVRGEPIATSQEGSFATDPAHDVFHVIFMVYTALGVLLQLYSGFCILRVARDSVGEYRFFMILCAIFDTTLDVYLGFLMQPRPLQPLWGCVSLRGPLIALGHEGARYTMALAVFLVGGVLASQSYSLAYRLAVVTSRSARDKFLSPPYIVAILFSYMLLVLTAVYAILYTLDPDETFKSDIIILRRYEYINDDDRSIFCFDFTQARLPQVASRLGLIVGLVVFTQAICVTLVVLIFRRLHANSSMFSEKTRKMHRQLTWLLLIQTFTPFVCFLVPITACAIALINTWTVNHVIIYIGILSLATFPKSNAILTILFVTPYRRFTRGLIRLTLPKQIRAIAFDSTGQWAS